jgi:hypothetical protein
MHYVIGSLRGDSNVPFQLIMMEDESIAYTTLVGYSQQGKGSQGGLFCVTRMINPKVTLNEINNYI